MIVFVHLLNDRSGSPKVLASVIRGLCAPGRPGRLFVGSDGSGVLDECAVPISRFWYRRGRSRLVTLFTFLASQVNLFARLMRTKDLPRDAVIYVNTLLPFGAAVFGAVTGRRVVYHLHEVSVTPGALRWLLMTVASLTADRLIYVSDFHRNCLPIARVHAVTVYNALDEDFAARASASAYRHRADGCFRVLMLASLRDYKGIPEFLALARRFITRPDVTFDLVANEEDAAIRRYFADRPLPTNVTVHARTHDPGSCYAKASLVVNLSRPDGWVETFGLTLLEAMAYGIPVIGPPVGGPLELVVDGLEGFLLDARNVDLLADRVERLLQDEALCAAMSAAARRRAEQFSPGAFVRSLQEALQLKEDSVRGEKNTNGAT